MASLSQVCARGGQTNLLLLLKGVQSSTGDAPMLENYFCFEKNRILSLKVQSL